MQQDTKNTKRWTCTEHYLINPSGLSTTTSPWPLLRNSINCNILLLCNSKPTVRVKCPQFGFARERFLYSVLGGGVMEVVVTLCEEWLNCGWVVRFKFIRHVQCLYLDNVFGMIIELK